MPMADETQRPEGVSGPDEKVSVSWLILQRLDDLKGQIQAVERRLELMEQRFEHSERLMEQRFGQSERRWLCLP